MFLLDAVPLTVKRHPRHWASERHVRIVDFTPLRGCSHPEMGALCGGVATASI
jgi:hypothetical protein